MYYYGNAMFEYLGFAHWGGEFVYYQDLGPLYVNWDGMSVGYRRRYIVYHVRWLV